MQLPCTTTINYVDETGPVPVEVQIQDGRTAEASINVHGFELIQHQSEISDWFDESEITGKHYDEIRALAKSLTGCDFVLFYPAVSRNPDRARQNEDFNPIQVAHSDYTESYPDVIKNPEHPYHQLISKHMAAEGITSEAVTNASRIRTLQFWRNVGEKDVDWPFAVCDTRSVERGELIPTLVETYGGLTTRFESFILMAGNETQHRWYTFPDLADNELLMFLAFDSAMADNGDHFWTPHTAFHNPEADASTPPRKSIEMRAICFWR